MKGKIYVHGSWDDIRIDFDEMRVHYLDKEISISSTDSILDLLSKYKLRGHFIEHKELKPLQLMDKLSFK